MKGDKTDKLILFAFDLLFRGDEDVCGYPLIARKTFLRELLEAHADQKVIRFHDHLDATGQDVIDIACNMKLEGIISQSLFAGNIPSKSGRKIHWAKPELVAGIEHTTWTNDGVLRQASCKGVYERNAKKLRPDWINLPEELG